LAQNVASSTLSLKGKVVGEGIASVTHASKGPSRNFLAQLCGLGRQMVMVTKVYKPNFKFMVEELERNLNVRTLDEACVSSMANKTYIPMGMQVVAREF